MTATKASDNPDSEGLLSNAERLQSHLPEVSLARALLAVWNPTAAPEKRREQLLQMLNSYKPEQVQNDVSKANKD